MVLTSFILCLLGTGWQGIFWCDGCHSVGEAKRKALAVQKVPIALDTFGGRIHVEWDDAARAVAVLHEFLKASGLFDAWVADCPRTYQSNSAPGKRAVLATFVRSILAGYHRYAHITAIRNDGSTLSSRMRRNWSPRMAHGWMSHRALPGTAGTWRRRHLLATSWLVWRRR